MQTIHIISHKLMGILQAHRVYRVNLCSTDWPRLLVVDNAAWLVASRKGARQLMRSAALIFLLDNNWQPQLKYHYMYRVQHTSFGTDHNKGKCRQGWWLSYTCSRQKVGGKVNANSISKHSCGYSWTEEVRQGRYELELDISIWTR